MSLKPAQIADNINGKLERLMPVLFPFGVVLGFAMHGFFSHVRPLVPVLFGLITLSGTLRLKFTEFGSTIRNPFPILLFLAMVRVLMPLTAMFVSKFFFFDVDPNIVTGFVLLFSGPVAIASFIWTGMFRGNRALCLTIIFIDTMLAPISVPGTLSILFGEMVKMDMGGIAMSLVWMVVLPTIAGVTLNETSRGKIPALICPYLSPVSKILFMTVIAANSSALVSVVHFRDPLVWKVATLSISLSVTAFLLARLVGTVSKCGAEKEVTLFFTVGMKNISVVTTIAVAFFPEGIVALPAITGILFQQIIAAVMSRFVKRSKP